MAKKSTHKIGVVTIKELSSRRWLLRYIDPATGQDVRRRLSGLDLGEVQRMAAHISQEALAEKGFIPGRKRSGPSIREALAEAIRLSRRRDHVRKETGRLAGKFMDWLRKSYPRVEAWADLKPYMIEEYVRGLEASGKAHDTVRLHLAPLKMAWRFAAENFPDVIHPLPKVRLAAQRRREVMCLEPSEVKVLLDWLKANEGDLWVMASLQALAGLRMLEVTALRRQDVDIVRGTVRVTDTGFHKPKTAGSERIIPVCSEVIEALCDWMNRQSVIPATGELFLSRRGNLWSSGILGHRWKKKPVVARPPKVRGTPGGVLYRVAKETGIARLAEIPPHRLRSSFATIAGRLGVPDRLLKAYLGHCPGDVLGEHYRIISVSELGLVSSRMDEWRSLEDGKCVWQLPGIPERISSATG